jgi:hypothetical protein
LLKFAAASANIARNAVRGFGRDAVDARAIAFSYTTEV